MDHEHIIHGRPKSCFHWLFCDVNSLLHEQHVQRHGSLAFIVALQTTHCRPYCFQSSGIAKCNLPFFVCWNFSTLDTKSSLRIFINSCCNKSSCFSSSSLTSPIATNSSLVFLIFSSLAFVKVSWQRNFKLSSSSEPNSSDILWRKRRKLETRLSMATAGSIWREIVWSRDV